MTQDPATPQTLTWVRPWAPGLLSFRLSRDPDYRFAPGQFARLSLRAADGLGAVSRAYSMVSTPADDFLEFYLIVIPGGAFSEKLAALPLGATVWVERQAHGFLTIDHFPGGRDLWLLATGTGLSPYLALLRDPATWAQWPQAVLVHSVRQAHELAYQDLIAQISRDPTLGGAPGRRLIYLPVVTREPLPGRLATRIPEALATGELEAAAGLRLDPGDSRVMICGNPDMVKATRATLGERGFKSPRRGNPGNLVVENYW
jgi:ferredoxin--NADP+ reductase